MMRAKRIVVEVNENHHPVSREVFMAQTEGKEIHRFPRGLLTGSNLNERATRIEH